MKRKIFWLMPICLLTLAVLLVFGPVWGLGAKYIWLLLALCVGGHFLLWRGCCHRTKSDGAKTGHDHSCCR